MTQQGESTELRPIFLKLPPERIVLLKCLIESYEELGELRTLNQHTGEIVLLTLKDTEAAARAVMSECAADLELREVPRPSDLSGDWLLGELFQKEQG